MKTHRLTGVTLFLCAAALAGAGPAPADTELVARLISFLGISATPSQMKAPDPLTVGESRLPIRPRCARGLTSNDGYSWPVFDPGGEPILALTESEVLGYRCGRARAPAGVGPRNHKLIGFDRARPGQVLVLRGNRTPSRRPIARRWPGRGPSPTIRHRARPAPFSRICAGGTAYGDTVLMCAETHNKVTGDVLDRPTCASRKATNGKEHQRVRGRESGQPSLSADADRMAYVRSPQN